MGYGQDMQLSTACKVCHADLGWLEHAGQGKECVHYVYAMRRLLYKVRETWARCRVGHALLMPSDTPQAHSLGGPLSRPYSQPHAAVLHTCLQSSPHLIECPQHSD